MKIEITRESRRKTGNRKPWYSMRFNGILVYFTEYLLEGRLIIRMNGTLVGDYPREFEDAMYDFIEKNGE